MRADEGAGGAGMRGAVLGCRLPIYSQYAEPSAGF